MGDLDIVHRWRLMCGTRDDKHDQALGMTSRSMQLHEPFLHQNTLPNLILQHGYDMLRRPHGWNLHVKRHVVGLPIIDIHTMKESRPQRTQRIIAVQDRCPKSETSIQAYQPTPWIPIASSRCHFAGASGRTGCSCSGFKNERHKGYIYRDPRTQA